jgi:hypothetical protein
MKVQQYKLLFNVTDEIQLPGFVFSSDDTALLVGFVSNTDHETYIEITLFEQTEKDNLPISVYDCRESVDFKPIFDQLMDVADETVQSAWCKLMTNADVVESH